MNILLSSLLDEIAGKIEPKDSMGISLKSPSLDYPVNIPHRRRENLAPATIFNHIEGVLNSNEDFRIDEQLVINVTHIQIPEGRGGNGTAITSYKNKEDAFRNKKSVIQIR